jgi:large subunit ribosomal protein L11
MKMPDIKVMVDGGKASAAAPLGPALGPLGVNIVEIVNQINDKTKAFSGMKVPVTISIDNKKNFEIKVGSPPTSALITKEAGAAKGAANPKAETVGNLSMQQVKKIAEMKGDKMNSYTLEKNMREVIGTANSMGVTIDGKKAKDLQKEISGGKIKLV